MSSGPSVAAPKNSRAAAKAAAADTAPGSHYTHTHTQERRGERSEQGIKK